MENKRSKLVLVLAGYQARMEGLIAHNEGLPSRFPTTFTFPDYSDAELLQLLRSTMSADKTGFRLQEAKHAEIAARRLGRLRGSTGFGNARAVWNLNLQVGLRVTLPRGEVGVPRGEVGMPSAPTIVTPRTLSW